MSDEDVRMHLGPALSPDGSRLMFLSERDRLSLDLFKLRPQIVTPPPGLLRHGPRLLA